MKRILLKVDGLDVIMEFKDSKVLFATKYGIQKMKGDFSHTITQLKKMNIPFLVQDVI
ncbi:MAG: hypothetical protein ACRC0V_05985 [Fusobacteriaceae bacterium]